MTSHTEVLALFPALKVMLAVAFSTETVPMLGMFSRLVSTSHAEALASISVDRYRPYRRRGHT